VVFVAVDFLTEALGLAFATFFVDFFVTLVAFEIPDFLVERLTDLRLGMGTPVNH
jgi:hypothetical protein